MSKKNTTPVSTSCQPVVPDVQTEGTLWEIFGDDAEPQEPAPQIRFTWVKRKKEVAVGQKFGFLTLLEQPTKTHWLWVCDCGRQKTIPYGDVLRGQIRSCGCGIARGTTAPPRKPTGATRAKSKPIAEGTVFEKLTVISYSSKNSGFEYLCRCQCGGYITVKGTKLAHGADKVWNCGCEVERCVSDSAVPVITGGTVTTFRKSKWLPKGAKFNKLTVQKKVQHQDGLWFYTCLCDCGALIDIQSTNLKTGKRTSCGCDTVVYPQVYVEICQIFRQYRQSAKTRERHFDLEVSDFSALVLNPCTYCGLQPNKTRRLQGVSTETCFHGVDRIDPNLGYVKTNICTACWDCNRSKRAQSATDFLTWAMRIGVPDPHLYSDVVPTGMEKTLWKDYKRDAEKGDRTFDISVSEAASIFRAPCAYCRMIGNTKHKNGNGHVYFTGIDRKNNAIGYLKTNVVPACKTCNYAKRELSVEEFVAWAKRLQDYQSSLASTK